jgi:CrcB protein
VRRGGRPLAEKATPPARPSARVLRERWDILLVIAAGGALGSLARWALAEAMPHTGAEIAWATLWANVSGAFVLGALMVLVLDVWPVTRYVRPFLGVGVLGGYTTFSTYMLDTRALLVAGQLPQAAGYLFGTLLGGLAAVWAGVLLTRSAVAGLEWRRRRRRDRLHDGETSHEAAASSDRQRELRADRPADPAPRSHP